MQNDKVTLLKVGLLVNVVVALAYGISLMIAPGFLTALGGGLIPDFAWLRWSGGPIIALAVGNIMVFRKPKGQDIYVIFAALLNLLVSVGLLISLIAAEYSSATWFVVLPLVLTFVMAVLLWLGRQQAKGILQQE